MVNCLYKEQHIYPILQSPDSPCHSWKAKSVESGVPHGKFLTDSEAPHPASYAYVCIKYFHFYTVTTYNQWLTWAGKDLNKLASSSRALKKIVTLRSRAPFPQFLPELWSSAAVSNSVLRS